MISPFLVGYVGAHGCCSQGSGCSAPLPSGRHWMRGIEAHSLTLELIAPEGVTAQEAPFHA